MNNDKRIEHIITQVKSLTKGNYYKRVQAPVTKDQLDSVIEALNELVDELAVRTLEKQEQDSRLHSLINVLVRYTTKDYSSRNSISEKGDEVDVLAAGINALAEELQWYAAQLKESKEQIQTILGNAPDAVIIINSGGEITTWNPASEAIFGWKEEEVIGKAIHEVVIPEAYRKQHIEGLNRFLKTGEGAVLNKNIQVPALRKDGSRIDVELKISPAKLKEEYIFIAFLRDISERKKSEREIKKLNAKLEKRVQERTKALQLSEQRYRYLFDNSPLPMWLLDLPSLRFIYVNESAIKYYGYSNEEFLSMTAMDIRPEEEKARYRNISHPETIGNKYMGTWKHLKKDGTIIHVEISVHDIEYEGRMARLVVSNDITEKIRAEEALRQSEARFKRVFNSKMIGFIFWNASGEIVDANDQFLNMVGYTRKELEEGGLSWAAITPPGYEELDRKALEQIADCGVCQPFEKEYRRKDGSCIPIIIGAASMDEETKDKGVAYIMDISDRKQMEKEIRELNKNLEKMVQARTEQLELVNKELESFSYSVSHDLRAPLRAIHGFSRILLEDYLDKLDDEGARLLNTVMKNAKKMGLLIDELLEFSRLGKKEINRSVIQLDKVVQEVLTETSQAFPHHARIIHQPLGEASADASLVKQVFQNLLMNAIKYSSKKEQPEIRIGVLEKEGATIYYVADNGAGFDMAYYNKLFGVFQRLHRQEEFEGIGVGLAIVQRIIAKHGGKIWAEGKLNEGATFYFTLENEQYE